MPFPDQAKLHFLYERLSLQHGNVSLMVGGGFSKNASPIDSAIEQLPSWNELISMMREEMTRSTNSSFGTGHNSKGLTTSDYLEIAQRFDDDFGRPALTEFVLERIPDENFIPGEMHARLLNLPWRNVYTTNWDSLLERTAKIKEVRNYSIVRSELELPHRQSPRIIKLHGSLDPLYPLIVTKNDYDSYPDTHAVFVTNVQSEMVDNYFCLIGFSGDDPNFENWASWVHDKLRHSGPKIYLAGWLELDDARVDYLKNDLNVTTIDLSQLQEIKRWSENECYAEATKWILDYLERGPPPENVESRRLPRPPIQEPDLTSSPVTDWFSALKAEPWSPSRTDSAEAYRQSIIGIGSIWNNSRRAYSGWIMAPLESRGELVSKTRSWQNHVLAGLSELSTAQRILAIRELIWRLEVALEPIDDELTSAALDVLSIDYIDEINSNQFNDDDHSMDDIKAASRVISLSLITSARFRLDDKDFKQRINDSQQFISDDPDVVHRINYEKCLWAAWSFKFDDLGELLDDWTTEDCDPAWLLRKSALLSEVGRETEAIELVEQAVTKIDSMPDEESSLRRYSLKGWALWSTIDFDNQSDVTARWNELASKNSDAAAEKTEVIRVLSNENNDQVPPDFDGNVAQRTVTKFGNSNPTARSYRAIRLSELAGMPVATPNASYPRAVAADMVGLAAIGIAQLDPELAIRQILRASTWDEDKSLINVLSRENLASLDPRTVDALISDCIRIVEHSKAQGWVERLRVAIEALSRLGLRAKPDTAMEIFDIAMDLYRDKDDWITKHHWIAAPLHNLLKRSFATLLPEIRTEVVLDVLSSPIIGSDDFKAQIIERFPEPANVFNEVPTLTLPERTAQTETLWRPTYDQLITAMRENGETRRRVVGRLFPLIREGFLTAREEQEFANALWGECQDGSEHFPGLRDLDDWIFMALPEPVQGLAIRIFRRKWLLTREMQSRFGQFHATNRVTIDLGAAMVFPGFLEDTLLNVGLAIDQLKNLKGGFELTDEERKFVRDMILQWSNIPVVSHDSPLVQQSLRMTAYNAVYGITALLTEVEISVSTCDALFTKLKVLTENMAPAYLPTAALVAYRPCGYSEFASWLRKGMLSRDRETIRSAIDGLKTWLYLAHADSNQKVIPSHRPDAPPDRLVRELGNMLASRRSESFPSSISAAKWVFDQLDDQVQRIIVDDVLIGLDYLSEELEYGCDQLEINVFALRRHCAALAASMARAGYSESPEVKRWLELASTDPFSEVRNELDP